jgi:rod shape-determining protein MreB
MWNKLLNVFSTDIGIDLGTANTLVYVRDVGIVLREPSVVAIRKGTKSILAVGDEARAMLGRTPGGIEAVRPMKSGVIADYDVTKAMLKYFIRRSRPHRILGRRPRIVMAVPGDITEVERRAIQEAAIDAGARSVVLMDEPMAAAMGVGLPVENPRGNMIVDIGGGTCDVAVISLSGIVCARSVRVGGDAMDECIAQYMRRVYNLTIGERMAEEIKIKIGSAAKLAEEKTMEVRGRDLVAGRPKVMKVNSEEIRGALQDPVSQILATIDDTLRECPPEPSADLIDQGMFLAGGGSMLTGLDSLIADRTKLPVHMADDPLSAVALGTGRALEGLDDAKIPVHS